MVAQQVARALTANVEDQTGDDEVYAAKTLLEAAEAEPPS